MFFLSTLSTVYHLSAEDLLIIIISMDCLIMSSTLNVLAAINWMIKFPGIVSKKDINRLIQKNSKSFSIVFCWKAFERWDSFYLVNKHKTIIMTKLSPRAPAHGSQPFVYWTRIMESPLWCIFYSTSLSAPGSKIFSNGVWARERKLGTILFPLCVRTFSRNVTYLFYTLVCTQNLTNCKAHLVITGQTHFSIHVRRWRRPSKICNNNNNAAVPKSGVCSFRTPFA